MRVIYLTIEIKESIGFFFHETLKQLESGTKIPRFSIVFQDPHFPSFFHAFYRASQTTDASYPLTEEDIDRLKRMEQQQANGVVMIIKDTERFFTLLHTLYEQTYLYIRRFEKHYSKMILREVLFQRLWLRMAPTDFQNVELFLKRELEAMQDETFRAYETETAVADLPGLPDYQITAKSEFSYTWDETGKHMAFRIMKKEDFNHPTEVFMYHNLPQIHYAIVLENGQKVCYIPAIQLKETEHMIKRVNRQLYHLNAGIPASLWDITNISPSSLLVLAIFISLLQKEGISIIVVPSMQVLSYEFHELLNTYYLQKIEDYWTRERTFQNLTNMQIYASKLNKMDQISQNKTEKLYRTFYRLMYHNPSFTNLNDPFDVSDNLYFKSDLFHPCNVKGSLLQDLYVSMEAMSKGKQKKRITSKRILK